MAPRLPLLAALAFLGLASPAPAQPKPILPVDCASAGSNVEMTECMHQAYQRLDRELNRVYARVLASIERQDHLTPAQRDDWKKALREAQRNWARYKDVDCGEVTGFEWFGGSGRGFAEYSCLADKTRIRLNDLNSRYEAK